MVRHNDPSHLIDLNTHQPTVSEIIAIAFVLFARKFVTGNVLNISGEASFHRNRND